MIGEIALTKTASSGQTVAIRLVEWSGTAVATQIEIDGEVRGRPDPQAPFRTAPTKGVRYAIGNGTVMVGLTDEEAAALTAAMDQANAARRAAYEQTPEGQQTLLFEQRQTLVDRIASLRDAQEDEFERRHAREDMTAWHAKAANEPEIARLRAEVAAFDVAHPEIIAALRAERQRQQDEAVRAAQWN